MGLRRRAAARPCTIAWLLKPEIFTTVERWVGVETEGKYTQGMTVVDYYHLTGNRPNTTLMLDVTARRLLTCWPSGWRFA
jgi:inosine-uridine nucleoside N-ribohydrolase